MDNSGILRRRLTPLEPLLDRLEGLQELDEPAKAIGKFARSALSGGAIKDALSGTWLGHAVHPMLTDVVIGSFLSTTLLDLLGGDDQGTAGKRLISIGILAYAPTALTGVNDWSDTEPADDGVRRVGLVHAASNATALALYTASLGARSRGARGKARFLSTLGATSLMAGGYLGGHMSLSQGVGPDQTIFDPGPSDWTRAVEASALSDGEPTRVVVDDTPVLFLRDGEQLFALHDRCSHRGCSLSDGSIENEEIVCACHGSRFDRRTGSVRGGPATAPQPAFEVREQAGTIEIRRFDVAAA
jgi:nitrite reductase/ring-hydroxylating ferredoxin subunit